MIAKNLGSRVWLRGLALVAWSALGGMRVHGQEMTQAPGFYSAPGYYGTSFGVPGYKTVRTYSEFSSSYGGGYGRGYAPYSIGAGRFGADLWRGGTAVVNPLDGASLTSYRTWAVPYQTHPTVVAPPIGVYAPAYGPSRPYPPSAYFGR